MLDFVVGLCFERQFSWNHLDPFKKKSVRENMYKQNIQFSENTVMLKLNWLLFLVIVE